MTWGRVMHDGRVGGCLSTNDNDDISVSDTIDTQVKQDKVFQYNDNLTIHHVINFKKSAILRTMHDDPWKRSISLIGSPIFCKNNNVSSTCQQLFCFDASLSFVSEDFI